MTSSPHATRLVDRSAEFRSALGAWYRANHRELPWRTEPSPYRTVVSEFMLQQTQIRTALPYFARWMDRFPDFAALAAAPEEAVLKAWEGLGYYSRARRLHALAKDLVARGDLPRSAAGWREFDGIGPYTAAAVASIAFGSPDACVDGNVVRILARLTGDTAALGTSAAAQKRYQTLADALLDVANPGDHNQAMMELGATLCTKAAPLCTTCPVVHLCRAAADGTQDEIPKLERAQTIERTVRRAWIESEGSLLLQESGGGKRLHGIAELPEIERLPLAPAWADVSEELGILRRSITRYRNSEPIFRIPKDQLAAPLPEGMRFVALSDLETITLSGPHRQWIGRHLAQSAR